MFARAVAILFLTGLLSAQPPQRPAFEVATIKLNPSCTPSGGPPPSPGRLDIKCSNLRELIRGAYGIFAGEKIASRMMDVVGGPGWLDSDRFDLSAKAEGAAGVQKMVGAMLQSLLEERFQLKVHVEPRDKPVYLLTVAKGTPKLTPSKEGSCVPLDLNNLPKPGAPQQVYCGMPRTSFKNGAFSADVVGATMDEFTGRMLANQVDRPVIDKTGLTGRFDIHLEFARDMTGMMLNGNSAPPPPPNDSGAPSIFTAIQQLGLKLSPDKAPIDVIVVDSAQKPSEN
jgi:uncharacterized protein (TIGR03435 family)